ncbi:MAG: DUF6624 domain-containing protein [Bacteroidota bacterium]
MKTRRLIKASVCLILFCSCISCNSKKRKADSASSESRTIYFNSEWVDKIVEAYQLMGDGPSIEAADKLFEASELMPKKNWENYLFCATIYASNGSLDKAFMAFERAVKAGMRDIELLHSLRELDTLKPDKRWDSLVNKVKSNAEAYKKSIKSPQVLQVLEHMWSEDQNALKRYEAQVESFGDKITQVQNDSLFQSVIDQWVINGNRLDSIVERHGWPGNSMVGEDGSKLAWAIPQHHPNVFYKKKCLSLIKACVDKGDCNPNHYAELSDRIARDLWQKQTYGSSMSDKAPYPIIDAALVNQRRYHLGLAEPVEVYAIYHGVSYESPTISEAKDMDKIAYLEAQDNLKTFKKMLSTHQADSARAYLTKAIKSYGHVSNDQLYEAAIALAMANKDTFDRLTFKILKVLIWREWERNDLIVSDQRIQGLRSSPQWENIEMLLNFQ